MNDRVGLIERAYELARSGSCRTATEIARRLKSEHYEGVEAHLSSPGLRKELLALVRAVKA